MNLIDLSVIKLPSASVTLAVMSIMSPYTASMVLPSKTVMLICDVIVPTLSISALSELTLFPDNANVPAL